MTRMLWFRNSLGSFLCLWVLQAVAYPHSHPRKNYHETHMRTAFQRSKSPRWSATIPDLSRIWLTLSCFNVFNSLQVEARKWLVPVHNALRHTVGHVLRSAVHIVAACPLTACSLTICLAGIGGKPLPMLLFQGQVCFLTVLCWLRASAFAFS